MAHVSHGAQPNDSPALPPGDDHRWLVIYCGVVTHDAIVASSGYLARERACVRHKCERVDVMVALLPEGLRIAKKKRAKKRARKKNRMKEDARP